MQTPQQSDQQTRRHAELRRPFEPSFKYQVGREASNGLAHRLNSFPLCLNANWRVIDDPLQWILQRRKGNRRGKNPGWENRFYLRSRKGLLDHVREYCGDVDPGARAVLSMLPEWYP